MAMLSVSRPPSGVLTTGTVPAPPKAATSAANSSE
jgi:hypothetical protein